MELVASGLSASCSKEVQTAMARRCVFSQCGCMKSVVMRPRVPLQQRGPPICFGVFSGLQNDHEMTKSEVGDADS